MMTMSSIQHDSWRTFPSEGGGSVVFEGDRMAVSGPARLSVWKGEKRLAGFKAPAPAPGWPRFDGQRVYWGPGYADLDSGQYVTIEAALPARWPGGAERPHVYAWGPRGQRLLGSFGTGDPDRPARVAMFDGRTGCEIATLWEGSGLSPKAVWIGKSAAVVGFGDPQVFDTSGKLITGIALGGSVVNAINGTAGEDRLLIGDLNRALAWIDTGTWTVLDRWPGPWMHGVVSPDGHFAAALEAWGKVRFARIENDRFAPAGDIAVASRAAALTLTSHEIATVGGGEVKRARLTFP